MTDIFGKVISIILVFAMLVVGPLAITMMMEEMEDRRSIINEVSNIVDEVADTKSLTEDQLTDFYTGISSYGPIVDAKIEKYVRVINPDPQNPGSTYTTYMLSEDTTTWKQGDIVKVTIKPVGSTKISRFVSKVIGYMLPDFDYTEAGRVR